MVYHIDSGETRANIAITDRAGAPGGPHVLMGATVERLRCCGRNDRLGFRALLNPSTPVRSPPPSMPCGGGESLPLHGTAGGLSLGDLRRLSSKYCIPGGPEVAFLHGAEIIVVVVDGPVIPQNPMLVEDEDLRSTFCPVGPSHLLGRIVEIREINFFFLGTFFHLGKVIL